MKNSVFVLWEGYYEDAEIKGIYPSKVNGIKAMEELYIRRNYNNYDYSEAMSIRLEEHLLNTDPDFEDSYVDVLLIGDLLEDEPELEEASKDRWKDADRVHIWERDYKKQFYHKIDFEEEE